MPAQIDFVDDELERLDKIVAADAISDDDALRLMTLPGVSAVTAIALRARSATSPGSRRRGSSSLLGLDPRVGSRAASRPSTASISKQGPGEVRGLLSGRLACCQDRRAAARVPSALGGAPWRNIATRRSRAQLVIIAWHLLSRNENYAFTRPSLYRP